MDMFTIKKWDLYSSISFLLLLVGGINLGIQGIIGINLIYAIFGGVLSRLIFLAIGVGAGYLIYLIVIDMKQNQTPGQDQPPKQSQTPSQGQTPNKNQAPGQGQAPKQSQAPNKNQTPGQGQPPQPPA